ncbi:MAG: hypothetical protein KAS72_01825 [Phycisphaerales bacterium]|nr:hypothetical protein [Phycisphaerales bacterium]
MNLRVRPRSYALATLAILAASAPASSQPGDDVWVEHIVGSREAQAAYQAGVAALSEDETSYRLLFDAWMKMAPMPFSRAGQERLPVISSQTLHPDEEVWPDIVRWARSPDHDEVFDLIKQAAEVAEDDDDDMRIVRAFGLPYGTADLPDEYIDADFVVLDDPVLLLSGGAFLYLDAIGDLGYLVVAEAYRRAEEGDLYEACSLLVDWVRIARQLADRDFGLEKISGIVMMNGACDVMRSILYRDHLYRDRSAMSVNQYGEIVDDLDVLLLDRIRFPTSDKRVLLSLVGDTFVRRGGVDKQKLARVFTAMSSASSPLRAFHERRRWEEIADSHDGYFATVDEIVKVWGDWDFRWNMEDQFDPAIEGVTNYSQIDAGAFPIITATLGRLDSLNYGRRQLQLVLGGTQASLAVRAYVVKNKELPLNFVNIVPRHMPRLPVDPFDNRAQRNKRQLQYFVPVRDYPPVDPRELPVPYPVRITSPAMTMPTVMFNDADQYDEFLIYSKGMNLRNDFLHEDNIERGDVMIWPPLEELLRSKGLWP